MPLLNLEIKVTNETLKSDIVALMSHVRPEWPADDISYKAFNGGQMNGVFSVFRKSEEANEDREIIIVRVFSLKVDSYQLEQLTERETEIEREKMKSMFDRGFEVKAMKAASEAGLIAPLYAEFKNGVVYGFARGETLNEKTVFDENVWPRIAEVVARFHCLKVDGLRNGNKEPFFPLEIMKSMYGQVGPQYVKKAEADERFKKWVDLVGDVYEHFDFIKTVVPKPEDKVVFAHGDLNRLNIIHNSKENSIKLIDFDLASHGYQAYDIAYHFVMACGHLMSYDPSIYPNEEFRLRWIRHYLKTFNEVKGIQTNDFEGEVLRIDKRVKAWTVYHHLIHGTSMLGMALMEENNNIVGLDPVNVSIAHVREYLRKKEMFL